MQGDPNDVDEWITPAPRRAAAPVAERPSEQAIAPREAPAARGLLEIDPALVRAIEALAQSLAQQRGNGGERDARTAIELDPTHAAALQSFAKRLEQPPPPSAFQRFVERLARVRSLVMSAIVLSVVVVLGYVVVRDLARDSIVFEPIQVPKELADAGLTSQVLTRQIGEELHALVAAAQIGEMNAPVQLRDAVPDFVLPEAGVSVAALTKLLRATFGWEHRYVEGEVVRTEAGWEFVARLVPELRAESDTPVVERVRATSPTRDGIAALAARELLCVLSPQHLSNAVRASEPALALRAALRMCDSSDWWMRAWGHRLRALLHRDAREFDACARENERAIAIHPSDSIAYENWGCALLDEGRARDALAKFERAIQCDPLNASAHAGWGAALSALGEFDGAIAKYEQSCALDGGSAYAFALWGSTSASRGDFERAIELHARAAELDPRDADHFARWGSALYEAGRYLEAIDKYETALRRTPNEARLWFNLGLAWREVREPSNALRAFREACRLDPDDARAREALEQLENADGASR